MISLISSSALRSLYVPIQALVFFHFPFSYEELHAPSHIYLVQQVFFSVYMGM